MLANFGGSRVQKNKNMTAPVGETGPKIAAPSRETNINKNRPRVYRIVHKKHDILKMKQHRER